MEHNWTTEVYLPLYRRPDILTLQQDGWRWRALLPPQVAILFDFLWMEADLRNARVETSLGELATIFRCSRTTILRRLRRLEATNLIRCYRRPKGTVIYVRWRPLGREILDLETRSEKPEFSTGTAGGFHKGARKCRWQRGSRLLRFARIGVSLWTEGESAVGKEPEGGFPQFGVTPHTPREA